MRQHANRRSRQCISDLGSRWMSFRSAMTRPSWSRRGAPPPPFPKGFRALASSSARRSCSNRTRRSCSLASCLARIWASSSAAYAFFFSASAAARLSADGPPPGPKPACGCKQATRHWFIPHILLACFGKSASSPVRWALLACRLAEQQQRPAARRAPLPWAAAHMPPPPPPRHPVGVETQRACLRGPLWHRHPRHTHMDPVQTSLLRRRRHRGHRASWAAVAAAARGRRHSPDEALGSRGPWGGPWGGHRGQPWVRKGRTGPPWAVAWAAASGPGAPEVGSRQQQGAGPHARGLGRAARARAAAAVQG